MKPPSPFDSPNLRDDLPRYPPLGQTVRVLGGTVPGPFGYGSSSFVGPVLYLGAVQQLRTDTLLPRDREPCLVDDLNGLGLAPGYYTNARLSGSFNSLPVYAVGGSGSGGGAAGLTGLTPAQATELTTGLSPTQIATLNNLNACQLQTLLTGLNISQIQTITSTLTATQISNLLTNITSTTLTTLVTSLTLPQIQTLTTNFDTTILSDTGITTTQLINLLTTLTAGQITTLTTALTQQQVGLLLQVLTPAQIQALIANLTAAQLQALTSYDPSTIAALVKLPIATLITFLSQAIPSPGPVLGTGTFPPYIPYITSSPSSTPGVFPGYVPVVVDAADGRLYAFVNNSWVNLSSGGSAPTSTPTSFQGWYLYTVSFTYLKLAGAVLTTTVTLETIPADSVLDSVVLSTYPTPAAAFTGTGLSTLQGQIKLDGSIILTGYDMKATASATNFAKNEGNGVGGPNNTLAAQAVQLVVTATGANLNALTAGLLNIWVKTATLPSTVTQAF